MTEQKTESEKPKKQISIDEAKLLKDVEKKALAYLKDNFTNLMLELILKTPEVIPNFYNQSRMILKDWEETKLEGQIISDRIVRQNIFGEIIVSIQNEYPKCKVFINGDLPHELMKKIEPTFNNKKSVEIVRNTVDSHLKELGYTLLSS